MKCAARIRTRGARMMFAVASSDVFFLYVRCCHTMAASVAKGIFKEFYTNKDRSGTTN